MFYRILYLWLLLTNPLIMKKIFTLSFLLSLTQLSFGQMSTAARYINGYNKAENKWYYHNFQIGVNMHSNMNGMFNLKLHHQNTEDGSVHDANYKFKVQSLRQFNAFAASAKNLTSLGKKSGIALTFGVDFNATLQSYDERIFTDANSSVNLTFLQSYISIPIGLAYKTGGQYTMDKADKMSFTLGMGIAPAITTIMLEPFVDRTRIRVPAFIHTELGFFAGINWVVKANIYPGNIHNSFTVKEYSDNGKAGITSREIKFSGMGNMFQIGIACMPFSFGWKNSSW